MSFLKGKKILFIAPRFHNLEKKIHDEMTNLGADVDYYDERVNNGFFVKVFLRMGLTIFTSIIVKSYYRRILDNTRDNKYDYVLMINIEAVNDVILKELKKQHFSALFLLFMWDSLEIKKVTDSMLSNFNRAYTFDPTDAKNRNMIFSNLFYTKEYVGLHQDEHAYDLCFIGTIHGDRYKLLSQIKSQAEKLNLTVYYYLYVPSKILFFMRKLFDSSFKGIKYSDVRFKSLNAVEVSKHMSRASVIVDLSHAKQKGLSMRTFETLGMRKKLLTTNLEVMNYDFYDKNNISVVQKENILLNKHFFENRYRELDDSTYAKYTLYNWLKNIFISNK